MEMHITIAQLGTNHNTVASRHVTILFIFIKLILKHHADQVLVRALPLLQPLLGAPLNQGGHAGMEELHIE